MCNNDCGDGYGFMVMTEHCVRVYNDSCVCYDGGNDDNDCCNGDLSILVPKLNVSIIFLKFSLFTYNRFSVTSAVVSLLVCLICSIRLVVSV